MPGEPRRLAGCDAGVYELKLRVRIRIRSMAQLGVLLPQSLGAGRSSSISVRRSRSSSFCAASVSPRTGAVASCALFQSSVTADWTGTKAN